MEIENTPIEPNTPMNSPWPGTYRAWPWFLAFALLTACATAPPQSATTGVTASGDGVDLADATRVRQALYDQHEAWAGTPYRYGGLTTRGIDCSGFVYRTFDEKFGLLLPRTTHGQIKAGRPVDRDSLRPGDLVFFKTGWKTLHDGIYIEESRFLHASSSSGVIISDLRNPYWAGHYLQARRVRGGSHIPRSAR